MGTSFPKLNVLEIPMLKIPLFSMWSRHGVFFCACWYWPQLRSCLIKDPTSKMITFIASSSECLNNRRRRTRGEQCLRCRLVYLMNYHPFPMNGLYLKWLCKKDDSTNAFCGDEKPTLYFMIVAQAMLMYLSRDWRTRISWTAGYAACKITSNLQWFSQVSKYPRM